MAWLGPAMDVNATDKHVPRWGQWDVPRRLTARPQHQADKTRHGVAAGSARQERHRASDAEVMGEQAVVHCASSQGKSTTQCRAWPLAARSTGPSAPPTKPGRVGHGKADMVSALDAACQPMK